MCIMTVSNVLFPPSTNRYYYTNRVGYYVDEVESTFDSDCVITIKVVNLNGSVTMCFLRNIILHIVRQHKM